MASKSTTSSKPPERLLEIQERPAVNDLSYIPEEIADTYEASGYRITLASGHSEMVPQHSLNSRFPVSLDDFAEASRPELEKTLRQYGFRFKDGYIWKGDCILYSQPHEARDAQLKEALETWIRHDRGQEEDKADELNQELMKNPKALGHIKSANGASGFRR